MFKLANGENGLEPQIVCVDCLEPYSLSFMNAVIPPPESDPKKRQEFQESTHILCKKCSLRRRIEWEKHVPEQKYWSREVPADVFLHIWTKSSQWKNVDWREVARRADMLADVCDDNMETA
jgi:hypothetical protein